MDCIVVAGGRPAPDDPFYAYTRGKPKALLPLQGRPMLDYVMHGLLTARQTEECIVVGLDTDTTKKFTFSRPVAFLPDQGSLVRNARAGAEWHLARRPGDRLMLFAAADVPLITGPLIDNFIDQCTPHNRVAYYPLVRREIMEAQFPGSRRTYARLKEAKVAGGDVVLAHTRLLTSLAEWGEALTSARKQAWKLVRLLGLTFWLKYLFHQLTVTDIESAVLRVIGHPVKVMFTEQAALAMDADKPHQLELLSRHLEMQPA